MKKELYSKKKGVQYTASGHWETTDSEARIIKVLSIFTVAAGFGFFITLSLKLSKVWPILLILTILGFAAAIIFMIVTIKKKAKEQPMEEHLVKVDTETNNITGQKRDDSVEIPLEEGKSPMEMLKEHKND